MKPLLVIKPGSKLAELTNVPGDFDDWILAGMQWQGPVLRCLPHENGILPAIDSVAGVVITGSGAMVTDHEPWMEINADWLRKALDQLPILGICFGHQLLAYALGGDVAYNPRGVEVGCVDIRLTKAAADDPLLQGLPRQFRANASHMQSVTCLPPGAVLLAESEMERHHAFRVGDRAWGLQFHPEFNATVTARYIDNYQAALEQQQADIPQLQQALTATPEAAQILRRFAQFLAR